jgi:hypothetical protein
MTAFEVVIRLGRRFDIQTGSGSFASNVREITVAFTDRESAEAALRDIQTSVRQVHDAGGEDYRPVLAGEVVDDDASTASGCACPGRAEGKHGILCEHVLRRAFGQVADAPEDVKQLMRERGRLTAGEALD